MRPNQFTGGEAHRVHPDRAVDGVRHLPGPQDLPRGACHPLVQRRQAGVPPEGSQVSELTNLGLSSAFGVDVVCPMEIQFLSNNIFFPVADRFPEKPTLLYPVTESHTHMMDGRAGRRHGSNFD